MASCCNCAGNKGGNVKTASPLICLVPRGGAGPPGSSSGGSKPRPPSSGAPGGEFQFLGLDYLKKHFNLPQRALYLDQFRRPLITFPISGENTMNFNIDKKAKTNQMILDGFLAASEAITAPSVFPFAPSNQASKKEDEADEEIIYILQLPDWEFKCPVHNQTIRTPRFIWHSCKKPKSKTSGSESKQGPGPLHRPKPWIISRHTDFDYYSQW